MKVICTVRKCVDLVSRSTITHTASCIRGVRGKWVTKSVVTCSHFNSTTSNGWNRHVGLLMLSLYLLTRETPSNKISNMSLHPTPVILAMKITIHLHATWMHSKSGAMELLEDLLSHISRLGNHKPSPIPKTTICVDGPAFVTCT